MSMIAIFQYIAASLSWLFLRLFARLEIHGAHHLRDLRRPFIVAANHESHFDPQLVGVALLQYPRLFPVQYMAKNELFRIPVLNLLIWLLGAFKAHRRQGIERSLKTPHHILKKGGGVIMFPEGKIIQERPKLGDGRRGAAMLALMTDAAILPMSIHTPHDLPPILPISWPRSHVVIRIGEPFYLNNVDYPDFSDENTAKATKAIMQRIADLYFQHQY